MTQMESEFEINKIETIKFNNGIKQIMCIYLLLLLLILLLVVVC